MNSYFGCLTGILGKRHSIHYFVFLFLHLTLHVILPGEEVIVSPAYLRKEIPMTQKAHNTIEWGMSYSNVIAFRTPHYGSMPDDASFTTAWHIICPFVVYVHSMDCEGWHDFEEPF